MAGQGARFGRDSPSGQVVGGRDQHDPGVAELAGDQAAVPRPADPDGEVEPLVDQADRPVAEGHVELDLREGEGEVEQDRGELQRPEGEGAVSRTRPAGTAEALRTAASRASNSSSRAFIRS